MVIIAPTDSPDERNQDVRDSRLRPFLDGHCWYPSAQRCGCGLNLRSAMHWTDHIAGLVSFQEPAAG